MDSFENSAEYFSGQELWFSSNNQVVEQVDWSETGEFNLRNDGNTLYVNTKDPWSTFWSQSAYTKVNL